MDYSPDGSMIATNWGDAVLLIDAHTHESLCLLDISWTHLSLAFAPDGGMIALGSHEDSSVQLCEVTAGTLKVGRRWRAHSQSIHGIAISPDGQWIATSSNDRTVKLWDLRSGSLLSTFSGHSDSVFSVRFSVDGSYIASSSWDNTVRLWEVSSAAGPGSEFQPLYDIASCTYSPDGRYLITGGYGSSQQFDAELGNLVSEFYLYVHTAYDIAFSPNGRQIAYVGWGGLWSNIGVEEDKATPWNPNSHTVRSVFEDYKTRTTTVAFSPCGYWLASGDNDGELRLYDTRSGAAVHSLSGGDEKVANVAFSPDGLWVVSCSGRGIYLWEVSSGELKSKVEVDDDRMEYSLVEYLPGSVQVVSCSKSGIVRLWDELLENNRPIVECSSGIWRFGFSTCGRWMATSDGISAHLWKLSLLIDQKQTAPLNDKDCVSVIEGVHGTISEVVWRPNKLEFATTSLEGFIRTWKLVEGGSGKVSVQLIWTFGPTPLVAPGAVFDNVIGLSLANRRLLEQRGATGSSTN